MSPCLSRPTAGDPPTSRTMDSTWRWFGLAISSFFSHASESPRRRAAASGCGTSSASSEYTRLLGLHAAEHVLHHADGDAAIFLLQLAAAFPGETRPQARSRLPVASTSTPSKSVGPFTSWMVSRLLSRNCMVRDSGSWIGVSDATCVARTLSSLSASMPTTLRGLAGHDAPV